MRPVQGPNPYRRAVPLARVRGGSSQDQATTRDETTEPLRFDSEPVDVQLSRRARDVIEGPASADDPEDQATEEEAGEEPARPAHPGTDQPRLLRALR